MRLPSPRYDDDFLTPLLLHVYRLALSPRAQGRDPRGASAAPLAPFQGGASTLPAGGRCGLRGQGTYGGRPRAPDRPLTSAHPEGLTSGWGGPERAAGPRAPACATDAPRRRPGLGGRALPSRPRAHASGPPAGGPARQTRLTGAAASSRRHRAHPYGRPGAERGRGPGRTPPPFPRLLCFPRHSHWPPALESRPTAGLR